MTDDDRRNTRVSTNRYELIIIAAREARRLNDRYRSRNAEPKSRVTTEAIRRTFERGIDYVYGADEEPLDDSPPVMGDHEPGDE